MDCINVLVPNLVDISPGSLLLFIAAARCNSCFHSQPQTGTHHWSQLLIRGLGGANKTNCIQRMFPFKKRLCNMAVIVQSCLRTHVWLKYVVIVIWLDISTFSLVRGHTVQIVINHSTTTEIMTTILISQQRFFHYLCIFACKLYPYGILNLVWPRQHLPLRKPHNTSMFTFSVIYRLPVFASAVNLKSKQNDAESNSNILFELELCKHPVCAGTSDDAFCL